MSGVDFALGCRVVILACLMMAAVLAPLNAWAYLRHHKEAAERRERNLARLKAVSVATYGLAAFCGTYMRIDREFTPSLPFMALGLVGYVVYLFMAGDDGIKKKPDLASERELSPPLGIEP